ncbi:MAG: apolipoprotein N-acyltransferase [Acidobacteria bacterium]|nr:apolipoprotein N-acyltransferase [Acidobacteriota bacterium]
MRAEASPAPDPGVRRPAWVSAALAVGGGVAWGLSHAAHPLPGLAWVALVPLFLLLGAPRPGRWGLLFGIVSWCVAIPWIVPTITVYGGLDGWLAGLALLLLATCLGAYVALFAALGGRLFRAGDALSLAALPALWVALEWLRAHLISGFPWNLAAYAWTNVHGALPLASWIGAYGVSAVVLVPSLGLALAIVRRDWKIGAGALLAVGALLPIAARWGVVDESDEPPVEAFVVQPDTPNRPLFDAAENAADYRRLVALTERVCRPGVLVLWPESAAWPRAYPGSTDLVDDVRRFAARGCGVLFNSPVEAGERTFNSVLLATPGGELERADKRHLVPFGEYVPLRRLLPFLGTIARGIGDFSPADSISLLEFQGARLGAAVCYEVVFPEEVAALVDAGANALVTVTNDAWYGDTSAPWQHLRAARFRAAENHRWMLRAAITGVSARIAPDGSLWGTLGVGAEGNLEALFQPRTDRTLYSRAPWLVPLLCTLFALAALARCSLRTRRGRSR